MIKSMTGFGRGELSTEFGHFIVEVKSVNSRTCTITVKLPDGWSSIEGQISSYIRSKTSRGQVNASVDFNKSDASTGKRVVIDKGLAREYWEHLEEIKESFSLTDPISLDTIAALPGVINLEEPKGNIDEIWQFVYRALEMAVDQFIKMKEAEGTAILEDLTLRLGTMSQLMDRIGARAPEVVAEYRHRLQRRISELLRGQGVLDESRIAMEVAFMAERCDITEELVRLKSHIHQISDNLKDSEGSVGRHLDFILQEINREINTIASKASDTQIATDCISFKDEIEKMREQVQNIE